MSGYLINAFIVIMLLKSNICIQSIYKTCMRVLVECHCMYIIGLSGLSSLCNINECVRKFAFCLSFIQSSLFIYEREFRTVHLHFEVVVLYNFQVYCGVVNLVNKLLLSFLLKELCLLMNRLLFKDNQVNVACVRKASRAKRKHFLFKNPLC